MLLSMTGFGEAQHQDQTMYVAVEVRTVNNRYLKLATKIPDVYAAFEGEIEKIVREFISRGTVTVSVRVQRVASPADYKLNRTAVETYWRQLQELASSLDAAAVGGLTDLFALPGVVLEESQRRTETAADWAIISDCLRSALAGLQRFREEEGRAMRDQLVVNTQEIADQLTQIRALVPQVVQIYRDKVLERVRQLLNDTDVIVDDNNLIREVSIFADRADITEEITRIESHLEQFAAFVSDTAASGRKLEFLTQEIFREVNTIGSKANNIDIAHNVVEMKAAVEKIRELLQNLE